MSSARSRSTSHQNERGVILIVVGLSIVVLMLVTTFVVDLGVLWLARGQAQNAADAGALAGATAMVYDNATDLTTSGPAYQSAVSLASTNEVLGETGGVHVDLAADLSTWEHTAPARCSSGGCVQVDVYRDGTHGSNALPTFFGKIVNITTQNTKATATAQVVAANASNCLAPYFLIDRYTDTNGDNKYTNPPDVYVPGGSAGATGYSTADIGTEVQFHDNLSPSGYGQLNVGSGTSSINWALNNCWTGQVEGLNENLDATPGNKAGQKNGLDKLLASDPNAVWDSSTQTIKNSCAPGGCSCPYADGGICKYNGTISPRIMQVALCAPTQLACAQGGPSNSSITVTNIISFFIEGYTFTAGNLTINAVIIGSPGVLSAGGGPPSGSSFLKTYTLIR